MVLGREAHSPLSWMGISQFQQTTEISQFSSVAQSCPTLCDPMNCSTPDFPAHHQLLEHVQIHIHQVGDAIQPNHPLLSSFPPAFNLSQHQGHFQWVSSHFYYYYYYYFYCYKSGTTWRVTTWHEATLSNYSSKSHSYSSKKINK